MKRILLALVVFLLASISWGDGAVFKSEPKLADPTIPFQRAFLRLENGVQTLVVSSTAQVFGETDLVWVLPLPAPPSELKPVRNTFFTPLESITAPDFHADPDPEDLGRIAMSCGILAVALIIAPFVAAHSDRPRWALLYMGASGLAVSLMFWFWVPPGRETEATTGFDAAIPGPKVDILQSAEVGSYQVEVVRGERDGVTEWMKKNSFALPERAAKVVGDYSQEGWVFLMARLRSSAEGFLTPHPLMVKFPSQELIYPMRLTGAMDAPVAVELFVAGAGHAVSSHLKTLQASPVAAPEAVEWRTALKSPFTGQVIQADLAPLLQEQDLVTRLRATATPGDMETDWKVDIRPGYPAEIKHDTIEGAYFKAARLAMLTGLGALLIASIVLIWREMNPLWIVVGLVLSAGVAMGTGYFRLRSNPGYLADSAYGGPSGFDDWTAQVLYDLDRPDMAKLEKMGAKAYFVTSRDLSEVLHTGPAEKLGDNRIGVFNTRNGVRVIVQTTMGARYEFEFPSIKP